MTYVCFVFCAYFVSFSVPAPCLFLYRLLPRFTHPVLFTIEVLLSLSTTYWYYPVSAVFRMPKNLRFVSNH